MLGKQTNYKKSDLTRFAKDCAYGANSILNGICMAGEIKGDIKNALFNDDEELLLEVSKRFAQYAKDTVGFDVETGEVQDFQCLIDKIVQCCEENDWFGKQ